MISLKDIHKQSEIEVTEKQYKQVCYLFNKKISHKIIHEGYKFNMPGRLGELSVGKNKMKYEKLHFNYPEWRRTGIKSFYLNEHSDNYYAFVRWNKKNAVFKNKHFYGFRFTRTNNRELASVMQRENGHQLYEIATKRDAI